MYTHDEALAAADSVNEWGNSRSIDSPHIWPAIQTLIDYVSQSPANPDAEVERLRKIICRECRMDEPLFYGHHLDDHGNRVACTAAETAEEN